MSYHQINNSQVERLWKIIRRSINWARLIRENPLFVSPTKWRQSWLNAWFGLESRHVILKLSLPNTHIHKTTSFVAIHFDETNTDFDCQIKVGYKTLSMVIDPLVNHRYQSYGTRGNMVFRISLQIFNLTSFIRLFWW